MNFTKSLLFNCLRQQKENKQRKKNSRNVTTVNIEEQQKFYSPLKIVAFKLKF